MAFSWRRLRRNLRSNSRPHDRREDFPTIGRYEEAPERQGLHIPFRLAAHDWTTLWGAASLGYEQIVRHLLGSGIPIDARDAEGRTALFYAVGSRQRRIVTILLDRGANADIRDQNGHSPLHLAVERRQGGLVHQLLAAGADPNAGAGDATTPLIEAVRLGDDSLVQRLLAAGAAADATDRFGHTPMFFVSGAAAHRLLPLLLEADADPMARARDADTPVHRALRAGDERLYRALVADDDETHWQTERGRFGDTLLHAATQGGNPVLVRRLLAAGAPIAAPNAFGHTALLLALTRENLPVATLLRDSGAPIGFLEAIALGDVARAGQLPSVPGFALDAPIGGHETPLMGAVARGRQDLVRLLLQRGARIDAASPSLGTALDVAVHTGQPAMARLLQELGADPAAATRVRRSELNRLLRGDDEDDALPPLPPLDTTPATAEEIYAAACAGADDDLHWLRLRGADIDRRGQNGETALHQAAFDGDAAAVRRLLAFGADPQKTNSQGETALALARRQGKSEIMALLEE